MPDLPPATQKRVIFKDVGGEQPLKRAAAVMPVSIAPSMKPAQPLGDPAGQWTASFRRCIAAWWRVARPGRWIAQVPSRTRREASRCTVRAGTRSRAGPVKLALHRRVVGGVAGGRVRAEPDQHLAAVRERELGVEVPERVPRPDRVVRALAARGADEDLDAAENLAEGERRKLCLREIELEAMLGRTLSGTATIAARAANESPARVVISTQSPS